MRNRTLRAFTSCKIEQTVRSIRIQAFDAYMRDYERGTDEWKLRSLRYLNQTRPDGTNWTITRVSQGETYLSVYWTRIRKPRTRHSRSQ